jgi:hypothetical protein
MRSVAREEETIVGSVDSRLEDGVWMLRLSLVGSPEQGGLGRGGVEGEIEDEEEDEEEEKERKQLVWTGEWVLVPTESAGPVGRDPLVAVDVPQSTVRSDMLRLLRSGFASDITLQNCPPEVEQGEEGGGGDGGGRGGGGSHGSGPELVRVHKVLLTARSPHFRAVFGTGLREAERGHVRMEDTTDAARDVLLAWLYADSFPDSVPPEIAMQVLVTASAIGEQRLLRRCEGVLVQHLDESNAPGILQLADTYACADLRSAAMACIMRSFTDVVRGEDFAALPPPLRHEVGAMYMSIQHAYALEAEIPPEAVTLLQGGDDDEE